MLLLSLLLIVRAIFSRSLVAASALAIISALPAFLAFENKAAVVFAIPAALTLFMGAFLRRYNKEEVCRWRFILKMALVVTLFAAVLAPLIWYYVHLNTAAGQPYWRELFSRGRSYSINQIALWRKHAGDLFGTFVLYPSSFFHRVYGFTRIESGNSLLLLGLIELFTASLLVFRRKWGYLILLLLSLVLSVASFCLVTRSVESWAGHHLVYALMIPFFGIAISLAALWPNSRGFVLAIILALLYVQVPTFIKVASARPLDHSDGAKNEILSMVNEPGFAAQHLVVHLSWGAFFQDSLFGPPEQMLTWSDDPKDPGIARLAAESGRKVVYIRLKSDSRSLGVPEQQGWKKLAVSSSGGWELWAE
jgi:hypothetical protein